MGFISTVRSWIRPGAARYQVGSLNDHAVGRWFDTGATTSGISVTQSVANSLSTFWACPTAISTDLATIPLSVYRRNNKFREEVPDHPVAELLYEMANPTLSAIDFRTLLTRWALVLGNGYALIDKDGRGDVLGMYPVHPDYVTPKRIEKNKVSYEVREETGRVQIVPMDRMFHLRGPSDAALQGMRVLTLAAETVGLGVQMQRFSAAFFANGASLGGTLEHPGQLGEGGQKRLADSLKAISGTQGRGKTLILEEGMKYNPIGTNPDDGQLLESRNFSDIEICQWFRMPPPLVQLLDKANYSNATAMDLQYVKYTLRGWAVRIEAECRHKLLRGGDRQLYASHSFNALERTDIETRFKAYKEAFYLGTKSPNDIRALEDESPIEQEGADLYWMQGNMVPMDVAANPEPASIPNPANNPTPPGLGATDNAVPVSDVVPKPERDDKAIIESVVLAQRPVFVDTCRRALKKEKTAVDKHAKRDDYPVWVADYRKSHRVALVDMLTAPVSAMVGSLQACVGRDSPILSAEIIQRFADDYMVVSAQSAEIDVDGRALLHSRDWTTFIGSLFMGDGNDVIA